MIDVKKERTQLAMTQKRLAHAAGVDARTVRKLERGKPVSLETKHAVYSALGLPLDRPEFNTKPPSIFETPEAKLNSAHIMGEHQPAMRRPSHTSPKWSAATRTPLPAWRSRFGCLFA